MARKAIDVVLLPDDAMTDKAIDANAELVQQFGSEIVLTKDSCLPHISLAMGCIDETDIPTIADVLDTIAKKNQSNKLKVIGVRTSGDASVFEVQKTKELQSLHETVLNQVGPYLTSDVTGDMIYGDRAVESTLQWIRDYLEKSSFEKFFPHITIGYGQMENISSPIEFDASALALCHLGNHCTCRDVLVSIEI
ncbi:MAG: 2'-5' RNA ligase family protein [Planctomycetota bacterium]|jgi:2'-5' RNA ligase